MSRKRNNNRNAEMLRRGGLNDASEKFLTAGFSSRKRLGFFALIALLSVGASAAGVTYFFAGETDTADISTMQTTTPTPPPQLSKEYIYAGSRLLAVDDRGIESDVYSRSDVYPQRTSDGAVDSLDVSQMRRFQVGFDPIRTQPDNEFQRADSVPIYTFGDGLINALDVAQARRYQIGLDAHNTAAGPTAPGQPAPPPVQTDSFTRRLKAVPVQPAANPGDRVGVNIMVDAAGNETEYGFTLEYPYEFLDPVITEGNVGAGPPVCNKMISERRIICSIGAFGTAQSPVNDILEILGGNDQRMLTVHFTVTPYKLPVYVARLTLSNISVANLQAQSLAITPQHGAITIVPVNVNP